MWKYAVALLALGILPSAAYAEWVNIDIWGNGILGQSALRHAEQATTQDDTDSSSTSATRSQQPDSAALPFARSGDLTGQIEEAMSLRLPEIVSLRFRMDRPSYFVKTAGARAIYRREVEMRGLPEDSVTGSTALFLAVGWELANEQRLSRSQNAAILRQTTEGLRSSPLARQSSARRQQEAEMRLIISALWLHEARTRASSPALMREMSDSVWKDIQMITGNDMRAYTVTAQGFTER